MSDQRKRFLPWMLFAASAVANLAFICGFALEKMNDPADRLGILTKDVEVGSFSGTETIFRLPKGLTVRDASPRFIAAAGQFEPYRFSLVITSDDETLVNYGASREQYHPHEEYYSVDLEARRAVQQEDADKSTATTR